MKSLLLALLIISSTAFGQNTYDRYSLIVDRDYYRQEGWKSLSIGLLSHSGSFIVLMNGPASEPKVTTGLIVFNTVGVFLDFRAIMCFREARRRTKLLESTPKL